MSKHFLVNPGIENVSRTDILAIEETKVKSIDSREVSLEQIAEAVLKEHDHLKRVEGRVIIKLNIENKNYYTLDKVGTIRLERQFNNLNRRETEPANAIVIDAENIPQGTEILVYYNSIHDSNKIFNYKNKSPHIGYYSIKEIDCYLYRKGDEWKPIQPYETALRVFEPHTGTLENIDPTQLKDILYVTSGQLKGNVVKTLRGCDFQCVFQDTNGKEGNIIIFRPFGYKKEKLEEEAIAVLHDKTEMVKKGNLLIGLTVSDCKPFHETQFHYET